MTRSVEALAKAITKAPEKSISGAVGNSAIGHYSSRSVQQDLSLKSFIVGLLRHSFDISPPLAMAMGRVVLACWPNFRRA